MKKTLLTIAAVLFIMASISAQDLYLSWEGKILGETITIWGEPTANEIEFHAIVHNNTSDEIIVKVRRNQIEMVENTQSQIYWGGLQAPNLDESINYELIFGDGQTDENFFFGRYLPNSKIGSSIVEYTFFNKDNEDQNVKITVTYWASPEGIAEEAMKGGSISTIYPNPAKHTVNLDYQLTNAVETAQVRIVNMLGTVVQESNIDLRGTLLTMDISKLETGIYFYTLLVNDDVYKTRKLVVQQ